MIDLSHVQFHGRATPARPAARPPHGLPVRAGAGAAVPRTRQAVEPLCPLTAAVLGRAGLDPSAYRPAPLGRRVAACLRALKAGSPEQALAHLHASPHLHEVALNTLLIGVSGFFRDPEVFAALRAEAIPALATRSRVRVWSIGCSTGEELYSLAMLLAEAGLLDRASLLGTDCREEAVRAARAGEYAEEALAPVPDEFRTRYFDRIRGGWRIGRALRRAALWAVADGAAGESRDSWDVVLCRNLLIYLQPDAADALLVRVAASLAPGGILVLGKAERPPAWLRLRPVGPCLYRQEPHGHA